MKAVKNMSVVATILFSTLFLTFCSSSTEPEQNIDQSNATLYSVLDQTVAEDLSPEEQEGLVFMREEEKLARDVYIVMFEKWNQKVFNNISQSEQRHTDAVLYLLNRYEITDPVVDNTVGVFTNQDLQTLYNQLIEQGSVSLVEALKVGAAIEEIDILDLDKQIESVVDNEDIKIVYDNLLNGSYNHLRAYVRNLANQGVNYAPQYLSQEEFDEIMSSTNSHGRGK